MTPHYADDWLTVYHGDAKSVLAELPAESVHCVVTSPPYWGLRDYGTASWSNGSEFCTVSEVGPRTVADFDGASHYDAAGEVIAPSRKHTLMGTQRTAWANAVPGPAGAKGKNAKFRNETKELGGHCSECRATRIDSQLGLEPTPEQYVENMIAVFREIRRVLRSDGTVWLNLGDSYANGGGTGGAGQTAIVGNTKANVQSRGQRVEGLAQKQLVGIPWRVAFALQADGWYLRSDIIWSKPNPMPESVTDRPTKSHEYLFLLSKSARYYYDADAVREGAYRADTSPQSAGRGKRGNGTSGAYELPSRVREDFDGRRNLRSVWSIATAPYPGAHFATFPPKLVEPCIKAGCPSHGVVLDPFAGSGTTGMVAQSLSRRAVLIDLSMDYLGQLMERNRHVPLGI